MRRPHGTGSIYQGSDGYWHAAIYVGRKRYRRRCWTEAAALEAVAEMIAAHRADLGYFYHSEQVGERFPKAWFRGPTQSHYPRSGVTIRVRYQVFERDSFRCVYCGATADDSRLVIDHIQPVADGGTDDLDNLATACQPCNAGKAGRSPLNLPLRLRCAAPVTPAPMGGL